MRRAWLTVIAYAALSAANQMLWLTFAPITTDSARHYGVSSGAVGWLAEIFPLVYVVLALPAGHVIDRWFRPGLAFGAILTAVGALLRVGSHEFAVVLAGQVLVALAQPFVLNAVTRVSGDYLPRERRAVGISVSSAGIVAGMLLALLTGAVFGGAHIGALLEVQAGFAVVTALVLCLALSRPGAYGTRALVTAADLSGVRAVWREPVLRRLTIAVFFGFGVFVALTTWLQTLLDPAGVSETAAGGLLVAMVAAGVVGSGVLPSHIAGRGLERGFVALSAIVTAAGFVLLAALPGIVVGAIVLAVTGFVLLTDLPVIFELAERRAGSAGGSASALLWLSGNLGGLVVALLVQSVVHHPAVAFTGMAVVVLGALLALRGLDLSAEPAPDSVGIAR